MKYLFDDWDRVKKRISARFIFLFLDFDGTLAPIATRPNKARISFGIKKLLKKLTLAPRCKLAVISGRTLNDIKKRVGIKGIVYAANHGLEVKGPKIKFEKAVSLKFKKTLQEIKRELTKKLSSIKNVFIEDKTLTLSVHYRLVSRKKLIKFKTLFCETASQYLTKNIIKVNPGKKLFEVRPILKWDKGHAVLWLVKKWKTFLRCKNVVPIYIGDDVTDEDVFKALRNRGITIFVGNRCASSANYYLENIAEVAKLMRMILMTRNENICPN